MAQGMWTKRFTEDGEVFYYNATLNKSEWKAPLSAVIHEADNLAVPQKREMESGEIDADGTSPPMREDTQKPTDQIGQDISISKPAAAKSPESSNASSSYHPSQSDHVSTAVENAVNTSESSLLAEQLLSAVIPKINQQRQTSRQPRTKRFKAAEKSEETTEKNLQASYHNQVNTYQSMTGDDDEGGKWLVR